MPDIEILAPVGSMDSLKAAVRCGADAVYLGASDFNARRNARNFELSELQSITSYCHSAGTKVYLTLNTLVSDSECERVFDVINCACAAGTDAFIIQDLGILNLIKKSGCSMPLHASTQMSVQTPDGIKMLADMGFKRAVLPRELSKGEIEKICATSPIELEMFIHGALCMCVSGQCYMSSFIGRRSGNRGLCAQPCRLPFSSVNDDSHDLSLKDIALESNINSLAAMGIKSFKIEGRMKRPEYVAASVKACKEAISGDNGEAQLLVKDVFSRSGFTDGYYEGKIGPSMFGIRSYDDVMSSEKAVKEAEKLYEKETARTPCDFIFTAKSSDYPHLTANALGITVDISGEKKSEVAANKPTTNEAVEKNLIKSGGTPYLVTVKSIDCDENIFIPVSEINEMRRKAFSQIEERLAELDKKAPGNFDFYKETTADSSLQAHSYMLRFDDYSQIPETMPKDCTVILAYKNEIDSFSKLIAAGYTVGVELERGIFGTYDAVLEKLGTLKKIGVQASLSGTLDSIVLAQKAGLNVIGGFTLNLFNSPSLDEVFGLNLQSAVVSPELTLQQISKLSHNNIKLGLLTYGRMPLMLTRNCPVKNKKTCRECARSSGLFDRTDAFFPVRCFSSAVEIYNQYPIYMADRQSEMRNINFELIYFTTENKAETASVIKSINANEPSATPFTRGLYYRGVL